MNVKVTNDGAAVVDQDYLWKRVGPDTPRGAKLQLIDRRFGVAVYGQWFPGSHWTHWAPLPKFAEGEANDPA